jgi:hypothetical protein
MGTSFRSSAEAARSASFPSWVDHTYPGPLIANPLFDRAPAKLLEAHPARVPTQDLSEQVFQSEGSHHAQTAVRQQADGNARRRLGPGGDGFLRSGRYLQPAGKLIDPIHDLG